VEETDFSGEALLIIFRKTEADYDVML